MVELNIKRSYPLLEGIRRLINKDTTGLTGLTGRYIIKSFDVDSGGWLDYFIVTLNRSDVKLKVRFDEDDFEWSPQQLYDDGRIQPDETGLYLSKYDPATPRYTIIFSPRDMLGLKNELVLETFLTGETEYNITQYRIQLYEVTDRHQFLESLKNIGETLPGRRVGQTGEFKEQLKDRFGR